MGTSIHRTLIFPLFSRERVPLVLIAIIVLEVGDLLSGGDCRWQLACFPAVQYKALEVRSVPAVHRREDANATTHLGEFFAQGFYFGILFVVSRRQSTKSLHASH